MRLRSIRTYHKDSQSISKLTTAQFLQPRPCFSVVLKEGLLIVGIACHMLLEFGIVNQGHVGGEHCGLAILVLLLAGLSCLKGPCLVQQVLEVGVVKFQFVLSPWAFKARSL